jgi:hypothetical protein
MLVCCNREMKVEKNGVGVETANGAVYPGDRYKCLACGRTVVLTLDTGIAEGESVSDPNHEMFGEYVVLKGNHNGKA